jgi:hypothetical protein
MPGYNHYSWCMCGWCYKTGSNGYSPRRIAIDFDRWSAEKSLARAGADISWSACFIQPNASCPVCDAKVYYYQNQFGSRVFFDEIGWPWPKHPCTDNSGSNYRFSVKSLSVRTRGATLELLSAAQGIGFDPSAKFRLSFGESPWDLLSAEKTIRRGFDNYIQAKSISPSLNEPVFVAFVSAKIAPNVDDLFGFNGEAVSFLENETLRPKRLKARSIREAEFNAFEVVRT